MDPAWLAFNGKAAEREPALRLLGAIDAEAKYGIPEGSVATRALMLGTTQPGTWAGEARRAVQYKGFTLSVTMLHGWRAIDQMFDANGTMPRGMYLANLMVSATVLGALSFQLKNIASGKDPERMDTVDFWAKAAAMGGAGGMFGDQVKTFMQTKGTDDAARLLSPTAGLALNVMSLTGGNIFQSTHGEKANFGREAVSFGKKYALPRLWYTSAAVDRLGWDVLQRWYDPGAPGAFSRVEQRSRKENDVSFWWRPTGNFQGPERPPALERAFGQ